LITGEIAGAEDAAQEAFVKAYYALSSFRPEADFRPWLLRIVVNEARNLRKAAQRRQQRTARAAERLPAEDSVASAEEVALVNERSRGLVAAVMRLREDDRLVIACRYLFDLSEAETAAALGIARGTVKSRLSRALDRMRESVGDLYPLLLVTPDSGAIVREALADWAERLASRPAGALANQALGRVRAAPPRHGVSSWAPQTLVPGTLGLVVLAGALVGVGMMTLMPRASRPAQPAAAFIERQVVVYGGDLSEAERQEITGLLGAGEPLSVETVSRAELASTLQTEGLPVAPTDEAVSSVALRCVGPGHGLQVRTQYITRLPAVTYAQALLTVGVFDASAVVASLPAKPVTGETALVGLLKAAAACRGGQGIDPAAERLVYEQVGVSATLAGATNDFGRAAAALSGAARAVITGEARDGASLGAALDAAATSEDLTLSAAQRSAAVSVLSRLGEGDFGAYARGYRIRSSSPDAVELIPEAQDRR
jgi:RNA polymerase sigma-70 factor (ECF subfamily)